VEIREFAISDLAVMRQIWNDVVNDGVAFPQTAVLKDDALEFFKAQDFCGVVEENGEILGLYILHPNNIGRVSHIANTSYAVAKNARGKGVGEKLVLHSIQKCAELGFKILQFNAVVASNFAALKLYKRLGFTDLGVIPGGFLNKNGIYEDIHVMYIRTQI